ncbi:alpha/beta hydrolase family protein [Asticcacaulis solisilvae]|uniref:alpha/beta hydrolase family protein n=1 Tax=Asticcacaulis solisilvae TaxID=1217274 RepID=UPI003FD8BB54
MKKLLTAAAAILALSPALSAHAEDAAGDWAGVLMGQLHLIVHITKAADGKLSGIMESVDQGDVKIPLDTIDAMPDHLKFGITAIGGGYDGKWDEAGKQWAGTWTQNGGSAPLNLSRATAADAPKAPKRPQEEAIAASPLPYHDEAVIIAGGPQVSLAGTLSRPEGKGPFPAVVLISGSGPNTRDEAVFNHKVFLVLADYLARQGIAVLRYDKRGVGQSTGDYAQATTAEFTTDAIAAAAWLRSQPGIDARHVGLLGHSEGGLIAPAVAVVDPRTSFIVLMAGPGLPGDQLLLKQQGLIARASGVPDATIAQNLAVTERVYAAVKGTKTEADAIAAVKAVLDPEVAKGTLSRERADASIKQVTSPWMRAFLASDPIPVLQKVRVPVLAIGGSLDLQVPPAEDLAAIKTALKADKDVTVTELPGLNHLFQEAKTGSPAEYAAIEQTLSPLALKTVGDWIKTHVK